MPSAKHTLNDLTAEYVRSILNYDPETGMFTWKRRNDISHAVANKVWNARFADTPAGYDLKAGNTVYRQMRINRRSYLAHRLAWLYMTGEWPTGVIDHVDRNGLNNRFSNLRVATNSQNTANARLRPDNKTGIRGVSRWEGRYQAKIQRNGKQKNLGAYDTLEEAQDAYLSAASDHFGEFIVRG